MTALHLHRMNSRNFRFAESTFADFPDADAREQELRRATDVGQQGAVLRSDGTYWKPLNGRALLQHSAIPVGVAGDWASGSTAGTLVFTTAYPVNAFSGYLYYAENTLSTTAHSAGFYWTVVTSNGRNATAYNNTYTPGTAPTKPTTLVPFAGSADATFAGVTTESTAVISVAIPAGVMGVTGGIEYSYGLLAANAANNKITRVYLGATEISEHVNTTTTSGFISGSVINAGAYNVQTAASNAATNAFATAAIDTSAATTLTITIQHSADISQSLILFATVDLVG